MTDVNYRTPAQTTWIFNPADYCFGWRTGPTRAEDGYVWDADLAHSAAKSGRDRAMRAFRAKGHQVRAFSSPNLTVTQRRDGDVQNPEIARVVTLYGFRVINPTYS